MTRVWMLGIAVLVLAMASLGGCDEEDTATCPSFAVGAVEGHVTVVGEGYAVAVGARALEGDQEGELLGLTMSDSTGWYRLELPNLLYRLELDVADNSMVFSNDRRDTVRVRSDVTRHDFVRSRATVTLQVPDLLEGREYRLVLRGDWYDRNDSDAVATSGQMRFEFPLLRPGLLEMELSGPGLRRDSYPSGADHPTAADTLLVLGTRPAEASFDLTGRFATISGRVVGSWQEADVFPPSVTCFDHDLVPMDNVRCEDDGSFTLVAPAPGAMRLVSTCTSIQNWFGGADADAAEVFLIESGDQITGIEQVESGIDLTLRGPGIMVDHEADYFLFAATGEAIDLPSTYSGHLQACNLPAGSYRLGAVGRCQEQIWQEAWFDGAADSSSADLLVLGEGELRQLEFDLVRGGRVECQVTSHDGSPAPMLRAALHDAQMQPVCDLDWFTDGRLWFPGLNDGDYRLGVLDQEGQLWWYPGTHQFDQATVLTITDHGEVLGLQFSLPATEEVSP